MWIVLALLLACIILAYCWMFYTLAWIGRNTVHDAFYGRPLAERQALRKNIQGKARWINLLVRPLTKLGMSAPVTEFEGTRVPGICTAETMAFARDYEPAACDVFVATQMKCGTTWMQQIVYQVLTKGAGEYTDDGHRHLYAVSPWIESTGSVRFEDAPLIEGRRLVKTHLGTNLCPYGSSAKYIYVVRHPAACLASSIDFVNMLLGPMAPQRGDWVNWFCSDDMWWGNWAEHADGWWRWSQERDNVLFVHYEELLESPAEQIRGIADFLGVELNDAELENVVEKSSYRYMKMYDYFFEMSSPTPFDAGDASFFMKGTGNRGDDISEADRRQVIEFCREALKDAAYPVASFYPDVA